ncbi:MAG: DUF4261 domain-containing protein [Rubripirellula sp.]
MTANEGPITLQFESDQGDPGCVIVAPMGAPVPLSDENTLPGQNLWPEDQLGSLQNHQDHWIVTSVASDLSLADQALMVTQVIDAILRSHANAVGVVWAADALRIAAGPFQEIARTHVEGVLPTMLWIATTVIPDFEDGSGTIATTTGMEAFGLMEIECIGCPETPRQLQERMQMLASYLIENGPVIEHGDTIGESEDEKILIIHADSFFGREGQVMQLRFPEENGEAIAVAGGGSWLDSLKSLVVMVGFLLATGVFVFAIVWGVGGLRKVFLDQPQPQAVLPKKVAPPQPVVSDPVPEQEAPAQQLNEPYPPSEFASGNVKSQSQRPAPRFPARFPRRENAPDVRQAPPAFAPVVGSMPKLPTNRAPRLKLVGEIDGLDSPLRAVAFSSDSKQLAYATSSAIAVHDAVSMQPLGSVDANARMGGVSSLVFAGEQKGVVGGTNRGQLRYWEFASPEKSELASSFVELEGHKKPIVALAVNSEGTLLVSLDRSGQLMWQRLTSDSSGRSPAAVVFDSGLQNCQAMHFDQATMTLRVSNPTSFVTIDMRKRSTGPASKLWSPTNCVSPDGQYSVTLTGPNMVLFGDLKAGRSLYAKRASDAIVQKVGMIPGRSLFYAMGPSQLDVWDSKTGKLIGMFDQIHFPRPLIAVSPDESRLLIGTTTMPETIKVLAF